MKIKIKIILLLLATTFAVYTQNLDTTFGNNGTTFTAFGNYNSHFNAMYLLPDNKIIAAGAKEGGYTERDGIFVAKYNTNGTLDTNFNTTGKIEVSYGSIYQFCHSIAVQTDQKIIVAGSANGDFALSRLNPNGTYDNSFSDDGKLILSFGTNWGSKIKKIIIQPDKKILAIGQAYNGTDYDYAIARFNEDGSLDNTFGVSGKLSIPIGTLNDFANDALLQPDQKIIIAGYTINPRGGEIFSAVRLNSNGTLDNNFGTNGKLTYQINNTYCIANAVALKSNGKIIIAGSSNGDFALVQLTTNGTIDTSFGTSGYTTTDFGNYQDNCYGMTILTDDKIILIGNGYDSTSNNNPFNFAIAKYNTNGNLDTSFSTDGKQIINLTAGYNGAKSIIQQPDGKLLVGGYSKQNSDSFTEFALIRLDNVALNNNRIEYLNNKINSYPNPTNGIINIEAAFVIDKIEILDCFGKKIIEKKIIEKNTSLDISEYSSGLYYIKINQDNNYNYTKILKL